MISKILTIGILISLLCISEVLPQEDKTSNAASKMEGEITAKLIKYIKVAGNKNLDEARILQTVYSQPGSRYDETVIQKDKERIAELYRQNGYFQTKSTVKIRQTGDGVILTFIINEGVRYIVERIIFEGNSIAEEELRKKLEKTKVEDEYVPQKLDDDMTNLKEFYQKRGFPIVQIKDNVEYISSEKKVIITINIIEGPKVTIQFSGNNHIESEELLKNLPLLEKDPLSRFTMKKSIAAIEEKYKKKGYYFAKVDYETTKKDEPTEEILVKFLIDERKPAYIAEIRFEGNKAISDGELLKYMETKPRSIFAGIPILRRWFSKGVYDKEILATDIHSLHLFYQRRGYNQAKIPNVYEIQPKIRENQIYLSIPIDEGKQLRVLEEPKIIDGDILNEDFRKNLETNKGEPYNPDTLLTDEIYLRSKYAEKGYQYAQVTSSFQYGIVTFKIDKGERTYLDKVRFFGNEKTNDKILMREFLIKEGEPFNTVKIAKTQQRLYSLGLFSRVIFETPGIQMARKNIDLFVKLEERKMNSFNLSGGYNPSEGYFSSIESFHRNLFGGGRQLKVTLSIGRMGSFYELNFIQPWLLNTRTRNTVRIFRENLAEQDGLVATGGSASLARNWNLSFIQLKYQYKIIDQGKFLELFQDIKELSTISSVELSFNRDTRDFFLSPTKGWLNSINLEYAGGLLLRGDNSFFKLSADFRYYYSINSLVLASALRTGYARGLRSTKDIIPLERFYAGGSTTIRGYKERSLGPVGKFGLHRGDIKFIFNTELRFPIYKIPFPQKGFWTYIPREIGGAVFFDTGNIWDAFEQIQKTWIASSIGTGLRIKTAIGPIRIDYAYPLDKDLRSRWGPRIYWAFGQAF